MKKQGYAPYEMTCLTGALMEDYLHDIEIIQEFARVNREAMIETIVSGMKWKVIDSFTSIHNYVEFSVSSKPILRKGAISDSPLGFKNNSRSDLLCDLSSLTLSSAQVVKLSSSNLTLTNDIDVVDLG